jgi:hypothetical protein
MRTLRITTAAVTLAALVAAIVVPTPAAECCPFCSAPSLTLTEQLAQSDAAVLVQWVSGTKAEEKKLGSTTYEIVQLVRGEAGVIKKGERVALNRYRAAKKGDLFMLMGSKAKTIEWGSPLEVSETSFNYISQAPSPEAAPEKRLAYFMKFLEFPDQLISNDAYAEFANAPYKHIAPLAKTMPRERLRKWIASPDTPPTRLGLYGLMLGLCGEEADAIAMKAKIVEPTKDFRLGIDGVMAGYLLLTGEKGVDLIDRMKLEHTFVVDESGKPVLDDKGKKQAMPFSETYAAMQALRFLWTYGDERIPKPRLRKSMRLLLDRSELADLVIADLARWKDWSVQTRLMELYGAKAYDIPSIKRAIVRYMLVSTKDKPKDAMKDPAHVTTGKKYLAALRLKDPKTVKDAERFFFLQ